MVKKKKTRHQHDPISIKSKFVKAFMELIRDDPRSICAECLERKPEIYVLNSDGLLSPIKESNIPGAQDYCLVCPMCAWEANRHLRKAQK